MVKLILIRLVPILAGCLLLAPAGATAAPTRYAELTVAGPATPGVHLLPPRRAPFAFDLLGARWSARPGTRVEVRARGSRGPWSPWTTLEADAGGPVSHAEPVWVKGSDRLQVRVHGAVGRLRIALVASDRKPLRPLRALQAAPDQPEIISRAGWGAVESLRNGDTRYAAALQMVFVHHTATPNGYSPDDVPAIIRSIYSYHVRSNGWKDIGYNYLVDAFGRVFEGRAGGIDKPVIGAQTGGFNTGSAGIAVIGDGSRAPLTSATREALTKLIAWRLDVAHVDPLGHATLVSGGGNDRYPAGKSATFQVVSGHRDALSTDCPGALIYPELDGIAAAAQALGTPKIVDATATPPALGTDGNGVLAPIAFRARVLGGTSWTLTVLDARGSPVASNSGSGSDIAWTWNGARSDGTVVPPGAKLAYRIEARNAAGENARALLASLGALPVFEQAPPLSLAPTVISPDGDGADDALAIGYTLAAPAAVTLDVVGPDGITAATLVAGVQLPAGGQSARWGGEGLAGIVADGIYTVRLHIVDASGQVAERTGQVAVIRAVRKLRLSRTAVGRDDALTATWQQTQESSVTGEFASTRSRVPAALIAAVSAPGPQAHKLDAAELATLPDGSYTFALRAQTAVGEQILRATFRLDRRPPAARFVRLRVNKHGGTRTAFLVVRLSEATTVRVLAGARVVVPRRPRAAGVNGFRFRLPAGVPSRIRLQLVDPAGNAAPAGPVSPLRS